MLKVMRTQAGKNAEKGVRLAKIGKNFSVIAGELTLEREDLLISQILLTGYTDAEGRAAEPAQEGDTVLIKRISDEKYAVICKVIDQG